MNRLLSLLPVLLINAVIFGCNKEPMPAIPSVWFNYDGRQIAVEGDIDKTHTDTASGAYFGCYIASAAGTNAVTIHAESAGQSILLGVLTNGTGIAGTYTTNAIAASFRIDGHLYGIHNGDHINLSLTKNDAATYDGQFEAQISDYTGRNKIISNGTITSLHLYQ